MMRVPVPARLRKAVRTWFDSRYISIADHRQDIRDALWEVQTLRREVATLQGEVERLRNARPPAVDKARIDDTHRLAQETAKALDHLLQNEVLVWQAIDALRTPSTSLASARTHPPADTSGTAKDSAGTALGSVRTTAGLAGTAEGSVFSAAGPAGTAEGSVSSAVGSVASAAGSPRVAEGGEGRRA